MTIDRVTGQLLGVSVSSRDGTLCSMGMTDPNQPPTIPTSDTRECISNESTESPLTSSQAESDSNTETQHAPTTACTNTEARTAPDALQPTNPSSMPASDGSGNNTTPSEILLLSTQNVADQHADFYYEVMSNKSINAMFWFLLVCTILILAETIVAGILARTKYGTRQAYVETERVTILVYIANFIMSIVLIVTCTCYGIVIFVLSKPRNNLVRTAHICCFLSLIACVMGSMPIQRAVELFSTSDVWARPWSFYYSNITGRLAVAYFFWYLMFSVDYAGFQIRSGSKFNVTRKLPGLASLLVDKTVFAVVQLGLVLGLGFGFNIFPSSFAWTSWVVLIRAAVNPVTEAMPLDAKIIAVTIVVALADLSGLAMFLVKLYRRKKDLLSLPFYQHAKEVLYLRLIMLFTGGLWFFGLFFGLLYFNLITPIDFVYYQFPGPEGKMVTLVGAENIPGVLLVYLVFLWDLCLSVLFLPASNPGLRGLFLFYRTESVDRVTSQRADFHLSVYGNDPTAMEGAGKHRIHLAPRTFYWDLCELCFNFAKLAYGPPYKEYEMVLNSGHNKAVQGSFRANQEFLTESTETEKQQPGDGSKRGSVFQSGMATKKNKAQEKQDIQAQRFLIAGHALRDYVERVHGYRFAADVFSEADGRAIVFESDDRIIVSFRGTASGKNIITDMDSALVDIFAMWNASEDPTSVPSRSNCKKTTSAESKREPKIDASGNAEPESEDLKSNLMVLLNALTSEEHAPRAHWKASMNLSQEDCSAITSNINRKAIRVHVGFLKAYLAIRPMLIPILLHVYTRQTDPEKRRPIIVAGHSLGGALASVLTLDLVINCKIPVYDVYTMTFGSPKVGNRAFAQMITLLSFNMFRFVNTGDVVSKVPRFSLVVAKSYSHCGHLVLIDKYGNLLVTPTFLEKYFVHRSAWGIAEHRLAEYARRCTKFAVSIGQDFLSYTDTYLDILDKPEYAAWDSLAELSSSKPSSSVVTQSATTLADNSYHQIGLDHIGDDEEDEAAILAMRKSRILNCL